MEQLIVILSSICSQIIQIIYKSILLSSHHIIISSLMSLFRIFTYSLYPFLLISICLYIFYHLYIDVHGFNYFSIMFADESAYIEEITTELRISTGIAHHPSFGSIQLLLNNRFGIRDFFMNLGNKHSISRGNNIDIPNVY